MALIQKKISLTNIGDMSSNIFEGTEYEFLPQQAKVTVSAIGKNGDATMRWTVGSVLLVDDANFKKGEDYPIIPDNILDSENVPGGQRMVLTFTAKTASDEIYVRVDIDF